MDETHSHSIRRPTKLGTLLLFLPIREPIHQKLHLDTISSQTPNFHNFIPLLNMKNIVLTLTGAVTLLSFGVVAGKPSQVINCNGSNDNCNQHQCPRKKRCRPPLFSAARLLSHRSPSSSYGRRNPADVSQRGESSGCRTRQRTISS